MMENQRTEKTKPVRRLRGADSVKTRRQKVTAETVSDASTAPVQDDMDTLLATHRIQRGLSRVSIRKRKPSEMSKLDKLNLKRRDLQQELKEKDFQLRCIESLLSSEISNESILDWCEDHGKFVGLIVRKYRETDF